MFCFFKSFKYANAVLQHTSIVFTENMPICIKNIYEAAKEEETEAAQGVWALI